MQYSLAFSSMKFCLEGLYFFRRLPYDPLVFFEKCIAIFCLWPKSKYGAAEVEVFLIISTFSIRLSLCSDEIPAIPIASFTSTVSSDSSGTILALLF